MPWYIKIWSKRYLHMIYFEITCISLKKTPHVFWFDIFVLSSYSVTLSIRNIIYYCYLQGMMDLWITNLKKSVMLLHLIQARRMKNYLQRIFIKIQMQARLLPQIHWYTQQTHTHIYMYIYIYIYICSELASLLTARPVGYPYGWAITVLAWRAAGWIAVQFRN